MFCVISLSSPQPQLTSETSEASEGLLAGLEEEPSTDYKDEFIRLSLNIILLWLESSYVKTSAGLCLIFLHFVSIIIKIPQLHRFKTNIFLRK